MNPIKRCRHRGQRRTAGGLLRARTRPTPDLPVRPALGCPDCSRPLESTCDGGLLCRACPLLFERSVAAALEQIVTAYGLLHQVATRLEKDPRLEEQHQAQAAELAQRTLRNLAQFGRHPPPLFRFGGKGRRGDRAVAASLPGARQRPNSGQPAGCGPWPSWSARVGPGRTTDRLLPVSLHGAAAGGTAREHRRRR